MVLESKAVYQKVDCFWKQFFFLFLLLKYNDSCITDVLEGLIRKTSTAMLMKALCSLSIILNNQLFIYLLILLYIDHPSEVPEKLIQDRFRKLSCFPEAFSSIHYKGTRTYNPPTDFSGLRRAVEQQLENNTTRSPRQPGVIYKALKVSGEEFVTIFICIAVASNGQLQLIKVEDMMQTCRCLEIKQVFHEDDDFCVTARSTS